MANKAGNDTAGPVEIADGVWWVGVQLPDEAMDCNPYLIIDGGQGVLIDPGSPLDFEAVYNNVLSLLPLEKIALIVAHHQDPDLCGSIPLFQNAGVNAPVALHWRTATLIRYYGIVNRLYQVNEEGWQWKFASGRTLRFIATPYCHFSGNIVTWDETARVLFSSDIFGSINAGPAFYADESYIEGMKAFHEHYMPSHEILKAAMDSIMPLDIAVIAPQHGRVIRDNIKKHIMILRELQCGSYLGAAVPLQSVKRDADSLRPGRITAINRILARLVHFFTESEIRTSIPGDGWLIADRTLELAACPASAADPLSAFLERMVGLKGKKWYSMIEPYVYTLLDDLRLPVPGFILDQEDIAPRVGTKSRSVEELLLYDQNTGLYNDKVFRQFLASKIAQEHEKDCSVIYFSVDNLQELNRQFGRSAGDEALKTVSWLLKNKTAGDPRWNLFRLALPYIACIGDGVSRDETRGLAERVREESRTGGYAQDKLIVSAAVLYGPCAEGSPGEHSPDWADRILLARLGRARENPSGGICDESDESAEQRFLRKKVLLVDPDESYFIFLEPLFTARGLQLLRVSDGSEALAMKLEDRPSLIIAEAMAPRVNGFELREKLLSSTHGKVVPYILISKRKDEDYIRRAAESGIVHFLRKPFSQTELLGLVDNLLR